MPDLYPNFAALSAKEKQGIAYEISVADRGTHILVLAPHGGNIEPGTSEIAKAVARNDLSMYVFEGLRARSGELHITSHRFDDPQCLKLVSGVHTAVAIHGRKDGDDPETVSVGGLDVGLGKAIASSLREAGFVVAPAVAGLAATDQNNICNRGKSGLGVQLELPRSLRDQLVHDEAKLESFADAIRAAIKHQSLPHPPLTPGSG